MLVTAPPVLTLTSVVPTAATRTGVPIDSNAYSELAALAGVANVVKPLRFTIEPAIVP
jgi:hypothetical protein